MILMMIVIVMIIQAVQRRITMSFVCRGLVVIHILAIVVVCVLTMTRDFSPSLTGGGVGGCKGVIVERGCTRIHGKTIFMGTFTIVP